MKNEKILEKIQKMAEELKFDIVGVVDIDEIASSDYLLAMTNSLNEWIKNGYHADMKWFAACPNDRSVGRACPNDPARIDSSGWRSVGRDALEKRKDILKVMPGAKSVICVAMNYYRDTNIRMHANDTNNTNGKIARYAVGRDYHKIFDKKLKLFVKGLEEIFGEMKQRLSRDFVGGAEIASCLAMTNAKFKYYSDTGPILERAWAVRAGLGFIGKNTNLITKYGSWVLLGEVITNIAISDELLAVSHSKNKHLNTCGSCRKCLDACPTGALVALPAGRQGPYTVDARKCISYLTIEHKGEIPLELRGKMGNRIFGCDACQEVCPFNIGRQKPAENEMTQKAIAGSARDLKEILSIKTDKEFLEKISPPFERTARNARHEDCNHQEKSSKQSIANIAEETKMSARSAGFAGSPVMRAKRIGLVRNACIAAGNSGDKTLLPYLKKCSNDEDEIIASHARWAIEILEAGK